MKTISLIFSALLFTILANILSSCNDRDNNPTPTAICDTSVSDFKTIFGTGGAVTYDYDVHSYNFVLSQNKKVCSIGYQSVPNNVNTSYKIKILQGTTVIYNQLHTFSSTATSYVTPITPVNLAAGITYTIERWQTNSGNSNTDNVGKIKLLSTFPYNSGYMSITGSKFYFDSTYTNPNLGTPNGTSVTVDSAIPFIDIVFEQ